MSKQRKRKLFFTALAFMLPFLILYTVFTIWPVIQGFYVSMHKWGLMGKQKYIGFDNYIKFAGDKKFWSALGNTCKFVVITAPMLVIIALILALLANRQTVMKKGLRISYYLPSILSVSVASFIAKNTFSPYNGLLNGVLHQLHILPANTELQFLLDPKLVWVTISVMTVWWTIGFTMMLYISALQDIDMGIYEAASIDGAGRLRRIWSITLPCIKPTIVTVLILALGNLFGGGLSGSNFEQCYLLGNSVNAATSDIIQTYVFDVGLSQGRYAYATAVGLIQSVISLILIFASNFVSKKLTSQGLF